jgi:hypothetical protein
LENDGHHLIGGHEQCVEGVNDTLLVMAERAGDGYAAQNEEAKVVGWMAAEPSITWHVSLYSSNVCLRKWT